MFIYVLLLNVYSCLNECLPYHQHSIEKGASSPPKTIYLYLFKAHSLISFKAIRRAKSNKVTTAELNTIAYNRDQMAYRWHLAGKEKMSLGSTDDLFANERVN